MWFGQSTAAYGAPSSGSSPYLGNPNIAFTGVTPVITASRTSGLLTPAFIQVSASATTAAGTGLNTSAGAATKPYEDIEYSWDFGDSAGTETLTDPTTNLTVNLNKWTAPEAAYCYRSAGTYTITLTARARSGPGTYVSASTTLQVTVAAFNASGGTFYYSAAGSGSLYTQANPGPLSGFGTNLASHTQHYLKGGDTFAGADTLLFSTTVSGVRVASGSAVGFGTGSATINLTSGANPVLWVSAQSGANPQITDIVFSNVNTLLSGSASPIANFQAVTLNAGGIADCYHDNCVHTNNLSITDHIGVRWDSAGTFGTDTFTRCGMWMSSIATALTVTGTKFGWGGAAYTWCFVVGGSIQGVGTDNVRDHHIYMGGCWQHRIVGYVKFGPSDSTGLAPTRNFNVRNAYDPGEGSTTVASFALMHHNYFAGTSNAWTTGNATNDATITTFDNMVSQGNSYGKTPQGGGFTAVAAGSAIQTPISKSLTERDGLIWGVNASGGWFSPGSGLATEILTAQVYRMKGYRTAGGFAFIEYLANSWASAKQVWTDNIFEDTQAQGVAEIFDAITPDFTTAGSVIDRNQYYAPNSTTLLSVNNAGNISFATWQGDGFDAHGSVANPSWPNPGNGNFG
jgi:hypothetical protein